MGFIGPSFPELESWLRRLRLKPLTEGDDHLARAAPLGAGVGAESLAPWRSSISEARSSPKR